MKPLVLAIFSFLILVLVEVHSVCHIGNTNVGITYESFFVERVVLGSVRSGKQAKQKFNYFWSFSQSIFLSDSPTFYGKIGVVLTKIPLNRLEKGLTVS